MPLPLAIIAGAAALAGAAGATGYVAGRKSRNAEVAELKNTIIQLQQQIEKLNTIIEKQNHTIQVLKAENKSLNALRIIEKSKLKKRTRGAILFEYAMFEYMEFLRFEVNGTRDLDETESTIFAILDKMFHGKSILLEEKGLIKMYISNKYSYEVKHLISLNENALESVDGGQHAS